MADCIEEVVRHILEEWEIPEEKIRAILTDNGSTIVATFRDWLLVTQEEDKDSGEEEDEPEEVLSAELVGDGSPSGVSM